MSNIETLRANLDKLQPRDREFADSLLRQFHINGRLSERQWPWVDKLIAKTQPAPAAANVGSMAGILAIFERAKKHLKHPAIVLQGPSDTIRINVAGETARNSWMRA